MSKVGPQDIEAKLRQVQDRLGDEVDQVRPSVVRIGAAILLGVVVIAYVAGRRRGRLRSTVVEVRRV